MAILAANAGVPLTVATLLGVEADGKAYKAIAPDAALYATAPDTVAPGKYYWLDKAGKRVSKRYTSADVAFDLKAGALVRA